MRPTGWLFAAALACLAAGGASAHAKDDVGDNLNALRDADVKLRLELVRRLGGSKNEPAAVSLCKIARFDDEARVRIAAAKALADFGSDVALPSLKELLTEGGIRDVRRHAAIGMSKRPKGLAWTLDRIAAPGTDKVERLLLVSELGDFPSIDAAEALERLVAGDDPGVRTTALRALAVHPIGRNELPSLVVDVLEHSADAETLLAALDVCDGVLDREIRGVLPALMGRGDRRITNAAECVSKRLDYQDALARRAKAAKDGYAPSDPPPVPVPSARAKVDVVYIYDNSGSMGGLSHVQNVKWALGLAEHEEGERSMSIRHAWVAMQDTQREAWDPPSVYFAPMFDSSVLRDVKWRQPSIGVDTQGMEVGVVLRGVLDRFDWRPGAERRVVVVSDNYVGDPEDACRTVNVHHAADGLTLDVGYVGYGIERNRKSWENLFVAAGGVLPPKERKK